MAAQAHQKGSTKSASSPSSMKTIQNIFFCIGAILRYREPGVVSEEAAAESRS